jgi:hypothetical protein
MAEPYDRQPQETDPAWEAFVLYRDLGTDRTLAQVAKDLGKSTTLIEGWSARHNWVERCGLWDARVDQERRSGMLEEIRETGRRHISIARIFQQKVLERLQELTVDELSPTQLAQWFEVAVRVERQALGQPGDIIGETASTVMPIPPLLTDDDRRKVVELAAFMKQKAKAG